MTVDDIHAELAKLRELEKRDRDAAAAGADCLRCQVLQAIADGEASDPRELAAAVLATCDEDIGRE